MTYKAQGIGVVESDGEGQMVAAQSGTRDVFISYASHDAATADNVATALEGQGLGCWIAPRDVTPGAHYASEIVHAIDSAKAIVLILSQDATTSPHVLREIERATSKRQPVVTLRLDQAPLPAEFEYFLNTSQWLDASGGNIASSIPRLIAAVQVAIKAPVLTPEAARKQGAPASSPSQRLPKRTAIIASLIGLVIAGFAIDRLSGWSRRAAPLSVPAAAALAPVPAPASPTIPGKSVAVLPFLDMSEQKNQEYFADGMAEEIIDLLVKLPGLKVIGRSSSFQFKGKNEDLRAIGAKLGVAYVVEGSVRRFSDQIRVTAQLIDTGTGEQTWSDHFDRQSGEVLKIQDEIAAALVRALQIRVGGADAQLRPTLKEPEAYDLYLRGRHAMDRTDEEGFEEAISEFKQALKLDPTSGATAGWLALAYEMQAEFGLVTPAVGFEQARRAAEAALVQDPDVAIAHVALGGIYTAYDWDWAAADSELRRAFALAPGDSIVTFYTARLLIDLGRENEALPEVSASIAADPLWPLPYQGMDWVQRARGHLAEAESAARRVIELSPTYLSAHYYLGLVLLDQGHRESALKEMAKEAPEGGRDAGLAMAYYALGRHAESDALLARMIKKEASVGAFAIAEVCAYRGQYDDALAWLERALSKKEPDLQYIKSDPTLRKLTTDPRYQAFLRKMSLRG